MERAAVAGLLRLACLLAAHFSGANALWHGGDFTYDGLADAADLKLFAMNFIQASDAPALGTLLISFGLPADAMPEPSLLMPAVIAVMALRHRKSHKGT